MTFQGRGHGGGRRAVAGNGTQGGAGVARLKVQQDRCQPGVATVRALTPTRMERVWERRG